MRIYSAANQPKLQAGQQVNRVGKYLYKHLDSSQDIEYSPNTCDVYIGLLYQRKKMDQDWTKPDEYNDMHEMRINLSITTYQNKIRVNIIEITPREKTIGYDLYQPDEFLDIQKACNKIYERVCKRLSKEFQDYEFIF